MKYWPIKTTLFINYFIFAILLNSVGTVIFQVQNSYGVSESSAALLEAFKDLSIAATSFFVATFISHLGYKKSMILALGLTCAACFAMPLLPTFWMTKVLFAATGLSFALIKGSTLASIGLVTSDEKEHASFLNFIESFFMIGVLSGYFLFGAYVNDLEPSSPVWLNVYYPLAWMALIAILLLLFTNFDESKSHKKKESNFSIVSDFKDMYSLCLKPLILIFLISAFLYVLIEQSIMTWLPTFNSSILNLSGSLSIQMASILAASIALGRFIAGIVLKKVDWYILLSICLCLAAILIVIVLPLAGLSSGDKISKLSDAPIAAFVFPMIGLCLAPISPAISSVILSAIPKYQHASMSGLIVMFSALGGTTGSIVTGSLFEVLGGKNAFYFSLLPITIVLYTLYLFKQQIIRTTCSYSSTPS
jgi:fucose permease